MVEDVRLEPRLPGRRLRLVREGPVLDAGRLGHEPRRLEQLLLVRVAALEHTRGERVGGEDDVGIRALHALGKQRDETGIVVPAV